MNENKQSSQSRVTFLLKVLAVMAGIPVLCLLAIYLLFWWSMSGTTYDYFGKSRTAFMESTFGITVDDNVKLDYYYGDIGFDIDKHLDLEVKDYNRFIEKNINYTPEKIEILDNSIRLNYFIEDTGSDYDRIGISIKTEQTESGTYYVTLWTPYHEYNQK